MNRPDQSHEELLDLVAVYALGAVSADEARFISAHLALCEECRREFETLRPAAAAVALSVDDRLDARDCPRMKHRLMQAVRVEARPARPARASLLVTGLALAAAIVLGLFWVNARNRLADLQLVGAHAYRVPDGEILKTPSRVYLVMRALPQLPPGRVYQAWTLAPGAKQVAPSQTFVPDARGFAVVSLPEQAAKIGAVAVSVEPAGGSRSPTTKPLFVKPLT
jgi:anti-sigma-K factor RskA